MLPQFRHIKTADKDLSTVQSNVGQILNKVVKVSILDGTQIEADLASGANIINHGLGRTPQGWIVVDRDSAATVYRTAWDSATLSLTASATVTVQLWVY